MRKKIIIVNRPTQNRTNRKKLKLKSKHKNKLTLLNIIENPLEVIVCCSIVIIIVVLSINYGNKENGFTNNINKTNKSINTVKNKTQNNNSNSNSNSNSNNTDNDINGKTIKIVIENSCEPKQQKNLSYFQYQDLKAHERLINPLLPPERSMEGSYGIPINVPTRGETGSFQQIGALYKETVESEDMTPGNNTDSVVLALFGKQTYPRSRKWTYYTSSDANHQVKMPLSNKGQKCDC